VTVPECAHRSNGDQSRILGVGVMQAWQFHVAIEHCAENTTAVDLCMTLRPRQRGIAATCWPCYANKVIEAVC
jgi:hypothetical protein